MSLQSLAATLKRGCNIKAWQQRKSVTYFTKSQEQQEQEQQEQEQEQEQQLLNFKDRELQTRGQKCSENSSRAFFKEPYKYTFRNYNINL